MVTRIRKLLEQKQLTPTQFADLIGVGRPVMSHILSERNKPSLEVVQRIISAFPELSLSWLLSGTGEMVAAETKEFSAAPPTEPSLLVVAAQPTVSPTGNPPLATPVVADTGSKSLEVFPALATEPVVDSAPEPAKTVETSTALPAAETLLAAPIAAPPPLPSAAQATPPSAPKPFRAARQTPPLVAALPIAPTVNAVTSTAELLQSAPSIEAAPAALASSATTTPNASAPALAFLAEPGKAIRRIVIFYRDGSFADYQPE